MPVQDPEAVAENELLGAATSIEAAAEKLKHMRPRHVQHVSFNLDYVLSRISRLRLFCQFPPIIAQKIRAVNSFCHSAVKSPKQPSCQDSEIRTFLCILRRCRKRLISPAFRPETQIAGHFVCEIQEPSKIFSHHKHSLQFPKSVSADSSKLPANFVGDVRKCCRFTTVAGCQVDGDEDKKAAPLELALVKSRQDGQMHSFPNKEQLCKEFKEGSRRVLCSI